MSHTEVDRVELIGNLLLGDLIEVKKETISYQGSYDAEIRKVLLDFIAEKMIESEAGVQLVEFLFLSSYKLLKSNPKNCGLALKYETQLFAEVLKLFEKTVQKIRTNELFQILPTLLMIIELYHGSLAAIHPNQDIISALLKVIESIQRPELA